MSEGIAVLEDKKNKAKADTGEGKRFLLFGASPDTGNMGVNALCYSTLRAIARVYPQSEVVVFDYGRGVREDETPLEGRSFAFKRAGLHHSKRFYRPENLWVLHKRLKWGIFGNEISELIRTADLALDLSAGDSFTDLYGQNRFNSVALTKLCALDAGVPLALLPQTYGPFNQPENRVKARDLISRSVCAWSRDPEGFEVLNELARNDEDKAKIHNGIDMAFGLEPRAPSKGIPKELESWLSQRETVFGLNVSGLIYHDPERAKAAFSFKADYRQIVDELLERILVENEGRVLLVPHVLTPKGHYESDLEASEKAKAKLSKSLQERVQVLPTDFDQSELKWFISKCDWFCGTRMHSTIAGLSTATPTSAIAYSLKTRGVFKTMNCEGEVADPRVQGEQEVVSKLLDSLNRRDALRMILIPAKEAIEKRWEVQAQGFLGVGKSQETR
jgi:polysaccharide pyruvyl transferase WcaK-like protein